MAEGPKSGSASPSLFSASSEGVESAERKSGSESPLLAALDLAPGSARASPDHESCVERAKALQALQKQLEAFSEWSKLRSALDRTLGTGSAHFSRVSPPLRVLDSDSDSDTPSELLMELNHAFLGKRSWRDESSAFGFGFGFGPRNQPKGRAIRSNVPFLLSQVTYEVTPKLGGRFKKSAYLPNVPSLYETVMVGCFTVSVGPETNHHFDEETVLNKTYPKRVITYLCGHAPEVIVSEGNMAKGQLHVVKGNRLVQDLRATRCTPDTSSPEAIRDVLHIPFDIDIQGCASKSFLQTLCIPDKMTLGLREFNIPSKSSTFQDIVEQQKLTGTYESNPALIIKGILVLQYMQDSWVADFVTRFCNARNAGVETPAIGAITKDFGATNKEVADLARGWIIYGTPETCVTVVGINPTGIDGVSGKTLDEDKERILLEANLAQYFPEGGDGFIIGFYDPTYPEIHEYFGKIRDILPDIPILGVSTYSNFLFKGIEIPAPIAVEGDVQPVGELLQPKIKMALMMINY